MDAHRGRRVNRLSLLMRGLVRIEDEARPDGSWPREARPMDEKPCCVLENQHPANRGRGTERIKLGTRDTIFVLSVPSPRLHLAEFFSQKQTSSSTGRASRGHEPSGQG